MAATTRLFKSFTRLVLPVVILIIGAVVVSSVLLAQKASHAPKAPYLVTPEKYGQLSSRGAQITEETWANSDGTQSRGWLLRGATGAPAIILLHAYGADRSYVLNLGVKINEATDFTILMPDQRGHGESPKVKSTSFGGFEADDALAALRYLRGLKTDGTAALVGPKVGFYGTEMGALAAVFAATKDESVKALALDSVPENSDEMLGRATYKRYPFASFVTVSLAKLGTNIYYYDHSYRHDSVCDSVRNLNGRDVVLLAGADAPEYQESTTTAGRCFPTTSKVEMKTDLNPSGYNITNASLEQSDMYDQRVIAFFKQSLGVADTLAAPANPAPAPATTASLK